MRCAAELQALGFETRERPFEFSGLPGRFATPLMGASAAVAVGLAGRLGSAGYRWYPVTVLALSALTLWGVGVWFARRGVLVAPVLRETGINLEATRPGERPALWLCAHLDTKSQPIPTFVRSAGIVLTGLGFLFMLVVAGLAALAIDAPPLFWGAAALMTLAGAIPVVLSMVGDRSPGALDNASGVATAVAAARRLAASNGAAGVGVLITDAEELGLAGARAWARDNSAAVVLNCEGTDDGGGIAVMFTGRRPVPVLAAVERAAQVTGVRCRMSRMIPGVLADSVAFTDAGMASVTFLRGTVRSLMRVHRASDDLDHLRGTGIAETAALVAQTARELSRQETQ